MDGVKCVCVSVAAAAAAAVAVWLEEVLSQMLRHFGGSNFVFDDIMCVKRMVASIDKKEIRKKYAHSTLVLHTDAFVALYGAIYC